MPVVKKIMLTKGQELAKLKQINQLMILLSCAVCAKKILTFIENQEINNSTSDD